MLTHETDMPRADQPRHDAGRRPDQSPPPADTPAPHDSPAPTEEKAVRETAPDATPATADSWREVQPELDALWQRHLERWPESERPPADRTKDEPGSWRGDGGQFLSTRDNATAGHSFERMRVAEQDISPTMQEAEAGVSGAKLVGFDYRLKGQDRFKEKVADQLSYKIDRSASKIAESMPDAVRYTFVFSEEHYVDGYWAVRQNLTEQGYELRISRNTWESADYKGVNTRWATTDNQRFEVQFHTQDSFEAKQFTHKAYERLRSLDPDAAEVPELEEFQRKVSAQIPRPDRVREIPDYGKREH